MAGRTQAEREIELTRASKHWRSDRCPGCGEEGLEVDTAAVRSRELEVYQCRNPRCRVVRYFGPRVEG